MKLNTSFVSFNKMLKLLLIICFVAIYPVNNTNAQTLSWEDFLDRLSSDEESEYMNWEYLYDDLCELHDHPLNINTVTKEQLEQLPFLSAMQVENILAYVYSYGPMQTLGELQLVEEMDFETRQLLSLFVYAEGAGEKSRKLSLKNVLRYGKHELTTRLDIPLYERAGFKEYSDSILAKYPNRKYVGDPYYHSVRYQFHYGNNVYVGFTAEKDPGEAFFTADKKGYDFYSYYFMLKDIGNLKALVIGNYRLNFGQGLVLNTDFSLGKVSALSSISSLNKGIRKHSSTSETGYFRGIAAAYRIGHVVVTGFYSNTKFDATLKQDSTVMDDPFITSLKTDGYHRTQLEISKKNNCSNELFGGNLDYSYKGLHIGLTGVYNVFNRVLNPSDDAYKKYYARGKEFYAYGVNYSYFHHRFTFAGETAFCNGGGVATLNTLQWQVLRDYKLVLIHRYYSKDYNALYASSFSESSGVQNESGMYIGVEATPFAKIKITGYFDFFRFPYLRYQASVPSSRGIDGMFQVVWSPNDKTSFLLKYRYKNKGKDFKLSDSGKKGIDTEEKHKLRFQWQYKPVDVLGLKPTFDYSQVDFIKNESSDCGYMITQNVAYKPHSFPLSMDFSAGYFSTDSYDSRLYIYEKGLLYSFSSTSFYYQGMRLTAMMRCDVNSWLTFIAKYGCTRYFDRETIGSSQQLIDGKSKQDIQLQLRLKF